MLEEKTKAVFHAIKKQNGERFAKILQEKGLLNIPNLPHILEYAGDNPDDALALVPVLQEMQYLSIKGLVDIPENYKRMNDQLVRFNYEVGSTYFSKQYYFREAEITKINPGYEVILDNVVLDLRAKRVYSVLRGYSRSTVDELARVLNEEIRGNNISVETDKVTKEIVIKIHNKQEGTRELVRVLNGCITSLCLYKTQEIRSGFMNEAKGLTTLNAPQLQTIDDNCFVICPSLKKLETPKLTRIGKRSFFSCPSLESANFPELVELAPRCFCRSKSLKSVTCPKMAKLSACCFMYCNAVKTLCFPKLVKMGDECFLECASLEELNFPNVEVIGRDCFLECGGLKSVTIPKLVEQGYGAFRRCPSLTKAPTFNKMRIAGTVLSVPRILQQVEKARQR